MNPLNPLQIEPGASGEGACRLDERKRHSVEKTQTSRRNPWSGIHGASRSKAMRGRNIFGTVAAWGLWFVIITRFLR